MNARTDNGSTPLHSAAVNIFSPEIATTLIKAGADVNAKTKNGDTPLDRASGKNKPRNAEVLRAAGGKLGKDLPGANEDKAVAEVNSLANAVRLYITQNTTGNIDDDFTLEVLLDGDDPYLENSADLIDPWGTPYEIIIPGEQNIEFDVMSYGPDKKFGGEDDIIHGKR